MNNDVALLSRHKNRLVLIGGLVADLIVQVDRLSLDQFEWQLASNYFLDPGGISTTALALGKLGCSLAIAGWVGEDGIGADLEKYLRSWPIDLSHIIHLPTSTTVVVQMIDLTYKHSRIILHGDTYTGQFPKAWTQILKDATIVYLTGFACIELPIQILRQVISTIISTNATLVFDPQTAHPKIDPELLRLILSHTNTLTLNEDEAKNLSQDMYDGENAINLSSLNIPTVFLRQGERGVTLLHRDRTDFIPAFVMPARNPLGAGDCFNAGILFGLIHGLSVSQTAVLGNALSGIKVSRFGTSSGTPTSIELFSFLNNKGQSNLATILKNCVDNAKA